MNIDWNTVPKRTIEVADLDTACEICTLFAAWKIKRYVYMIKYNGIVIKYGHSVDEKSQPGNRLYRQIGQCEVWENDPKYQRIRGDSGSEWRMIEQRFHETYGYKMMKDQMTIEVYDFTNYVFTTIDPKKEVQYAEEELIDTFKNITGTPPIGNVKQDKNYKKRGHIPKKTFDGLFELAY